jgi:hypothetical protein
MHLFLTPLRWLPTCKRQAWMKVKALATGLYNSQDRSIENLATKQDVELVKKDLEVVKQELNAKIDKLDAKFDSKIDKLDSKVDLIRKDMESNHQLVK